jgi:hypothetical protein
MWLMWLVTSARMAGTEAVVPVAGGLPDREIGGGPGWWGRPFETRQRGANQRPVHRPLIVRWPCLVIAGGGLRDGLFSRGLVLIRRGHDLNLRRGRFSAGYGAWGSRRRLTELWNARREGRGVGFPAKPRQPGLLVFMLRLARRATRLLHIVPDHRHHHMVGEAAFPGAIIVKDVTKPKLALLHQNLPSVEPRWIKEGKRDRRGPY